MRSLSLSLFKPLQGPLVQNKEKSTFSLRLEKNPASIFQARLTCRSHFKRPKQHKLTSDSWE